MRSGEVPSKRLGNVYWVYYLGGWVGVHGKVQRARSRNLAMNLNTNFKGKRKCINSGNAMHCAIRHANLCRVVQCYNMSSVGGIPSASSMHETSVRNQRDRPAIGSYTSQSHMWVGGVFRAAHPVKFVQQKLAGKWHMRVNAHYTHTSIYTR